MNFISISVFNRSNEFWQMIMVLQKLKKLEFWAGGSEPSTFLGSGVQARLNFWMNFSEFLLNLILLNLIESKESNRVIQVKTQVFEAFGL